MIQQDYILRMIEKFAQIVAQINGLNRTGDLDGAGEIIAQTTGELVGMDPDEVCCQSNAKLISLLIKGKAPQEARERCFMLVTLMAESGCNSGAQGEVEKQRAFFLKALDLHMTIGSFAAEDVVPDYVPKLEHLLELVRDEPLPARTLVGLMAFHEAQSQLGKAEDRLFELVAVTDPKKPALDLGYSFFHRQLAKSDEDLELGGLPRPEVVGGIAELDRLHSGVA
jgi:hypothetical protein